MILRYLIPLNPVGVNALYERHPGGIHKSDSARVFAEAAAAYGMRARKRAGWKPLEGAVEVLLVAYMENPAMDVDAPLKLVQDSLQKSNARKRMIGAGIIGDDVQVVRVHVEKRWDVTRRPGVEVLVAPAGELFPPQLVNDLLEKVKAA